MRSHRLSATVAGSLYLVTHVTSIAALVLYGTIVTNVHLPLGPGADTRLLLGAFLEVLLALAVIGTAVTLFPVVRWYNEGVALGYVGVRGLEAAVIAVGVIPLLAIVTLRQQGVLVDTHTLVALHNWTFLVGPGFVTGADTVLMAYLMFVSRLVPRIIPILGLIGGPLVFLGSACQLFGLYPQFSAPSIIPAVPTFAWELGLALYLIIRGFRQQAPEARLAAA